MRHKRQALAAGTAMVLTLMSAMAFAPAAAAQTEGASGTQDATPPVAVNEPAPADEHIGEPGEIVVTGTSIRGLVKPVGASTVAVNREEVKALGVTSTVDVLANIPQIRSFGAAPSGAASATQSFAIPALRVLPNTQPGDGTLFLWNGNRMVGGGFSTRPDPAVIPASAIERVEVVLGGGSAIYGSDAVAGTINFMLRKTLDGAEVRGSYGFADHYSTFNVAAAVGKVWDGGNFLVAADFSGHSRIYGRDRDYFTNDNRFRGGSNFLATTCPLANVQVGSGASAVTYAYPSWSTTPNSCDLVKAQDLYPRERRWTVLGSFNQQLTDNLEFGVDAYYSRRTDQFRVPQTAQSGIITRANPFFLAPSPAPATSSETVRFTFASVFGDSLISDQEFTTWQIMPSLKWSIGSGWRAVATFNYGYGDGVVHQDDINPALVASALAGTTAATALNPFNLSQTNPAVLAQIRDYNKYNMRDHEAVQSKVVLDGPLFRLPAGDVKLAIGAERYWEDQYSIEAIGPLGAEDPNLAGGEAYRDRTVWSAFAEAVIPIFGPDNAIPGFHSLTLNLSGRYDHYSDFGSTWNPKVAGTWSPVDGLAIRGSFSKAFVAPSLNSMAKPPSVQVSATTLSALVPAGGSTNRPSLTIQGGNPTLQPETAKTFDIGFDLAPRFLPGFTASATYYHINMRNVVAGPNTNLFFSSPGYARFYLANPTSLDQIRAFNNLGTFPIEQGRRLDEFGMPQIVIDSRTANLGRAIVSGLDYAVQYRFDTEFGEFTPAIAGTHGLRLDSATPTGSPFADLFENGFPRDAFTASLTYANGPVKGRVSWDYLGGFPVLNVVNQTRVESFQMVNLFLSYELPKRGLLDGTTISVNADNIFDEEPSFRNASGGGIGQGSFIGRFFSIRLEKKF